MPRPDPAAAPAPRAPAPAPAGGLLGRATGSLGDAGEPGFWVMTPLVPAPREGRVRLPGGPAVAVELRPYGGGGTLLSAAAMQALGVALTALPEIEILAP